MDTTEEKKERNWNSPLFYMVHELELLDLSVYHTKNILFNVEYV